MEGCRVDALIFDFDGVVVDSEPAHLVGFRRLLETVGVTLSEEDYYGKYLGFDDHDGFAVAARDAGVTLGEAKIAEMTAAKTKIIQQMFAESIEALPGAVELILSAEGAGVPLAICSGALREEIVQASRAVGVGDAFRLIVSAEDVRRGKPDPEGYRMAMQQLREATGDDLRAERSVVVEDSPAGIDAARAAGMHVLAVTSSYPADALGRADRIVASLAEATVESLEELL